MTYTIKKSGRYGIISPLPVGKLANMLNKQMSYTKPGIEFMPNPMWGIVRLYNVKKGVFPWGLHNLAERVFEKWREYSGEKFEIEKNEQKFLIGLYDAELRDYQRFAINKLFENDGGILCLPTGSGKTRIAVEYIKQLNVTTLVVVTTLDLVKQWQKQVPSNVAVRTYQGIKDYADLKDYELVIFDECLHGDTNIRLPDNTEVNIKNIVEKQEVKEVLSFNEEKNIFESKRILRYIKQPTRESWYELTIQDTEGNKHKIKATTNHKIWTSDGYKQVSELIDNDLLKVYLEPKKYRCDICNKFFDNRAAKGNCIALHKHPDRNSIGGKAGILSMKKSGKLKELAMNMNIKREINGKWRKSLKLMGERRKGENNPIFRHIDTIDKIRNTHKGIFKNKSEEEKIKQITTFNNAPKMARSNGITYLEKFIINLNIKEIEYTSHGKFWYKFKNGKYKNPDFKILNQNKVIEVGDTTYWHTIEDIEETKKLYEEIGVNCLYLTEKDIKNPEVIDVIKKFIYNHEARVISIRKTNVVGRGYKYNLEVEDNHNFIANNILVSNCHHCSSKSLYKIAMHCPNAQIIGLSATPRREDNADLKVWGAAGEIVCEISRKEMIEQGFLCNAKVKYLKVPADIFKYYENYQQAYKSYIVENAERNKLIAKIAEEEFDNGKKVLVLFNQIEHMDNVRSIIDSDVIYITGRINKKEREQKIKEINDTNCGVIILASTLFDEGVDLPSVDVIILSGAGKSGVKLIQRVGRILRNSPGKKEAIVYDFIDSCRWLDSHYRRRRKLLEQDFEVSEN